MAIGPKLDHGMCNEVQLVADRYNELLADDAGRKLLGELRTRLEQFENICDARAATVLARPAEQRLLAKIKTMWYDPENHHWLGDDHQRHPDPDITRKVHEAYRVGTIELLNVVLQHGMPCEIWGQCYHAVPQFHLTARREPAGLVILTMLVPDTKPSPYNCSEVRTTAPANEPAKLAAVEPTPVRWAINSDPEEAPVGASLA